MIDQNLLGLEPYRFAGVFRSGGFFAREQNLKESYGDDDEYCSSEKRKSPNQADSKTQQETKKTKAEKKRKRFERRLVKYEELPEYLRDNEYILDYYRCEWPLKDAFLSVFSVLRLLR